MCKKAKKMTIEEKVALWDELVEKIEEFRLECIEEFRRRSSAGRSLTT